MEELKVDVTDFISEEDEALVEIEEITFEDAMVVEIIRRIFDFLRSSIARLLDKVSSLSISVFFLFFFSSRF